MSTKKRVLFTNLGLLIVTLSLAAGARAQERLSPLERAPVPLTDVDQERARARMLSTSEVNRTGGAKSGSGPILSGTRHIWSGNPAIDTIVSEAASRYNLDPCLILSVMKAESGFNNRAVSPKGALGLMQLMPATASRFGTRNAFDPRENVMGGASYLRWLLDRFRGDVRLAIAGYNAGEGAVELYGYRIPPFVETQGYVKMVYSRYSSAHPASLPEGRTPAVAATTSRDAVQVPTYNQIIRFTSSGGEGGGKFITIRQAVPTWVP